MHTKMFHIAQGRVDELHGAATSAVAMGENIDGPLILETEMRGCSVNQSMSQSIPISFVCGYKLINHPVRSTNQSINQPIRHQPTNPF